MKPIKEILGDTKPKNVTKITKALEQGNLHIYWIPLVPLGGWKFKACPNCGISQKITSEEFKSLKA